MKKQILAVCVLGAVAFPAIADGVYVVGDVGQSKFEASADGVTESKTETTYSLGGGYKFNKNLAVEVSYRDFGSLNEGGVSMDSTAVQASVVGSLPVSDVFDLYGRVGVGRVKFEVSFNDGEDPFSGSATKTKAFFGVGARYAVADKIGIRAEYSRYAKVEELTLSALTVGVDFSF